MPRIPPPIEVIKHNYVVKLIDLARISGIKYSTLVYYKNKQLLPHVLLEGKRTPCYEPSLCLKRLKEIKKLKTQNLNLAEIQKYFNDIEL